MLRCWSMKNRSLESLLASVATALLLPAAVASPPSLAEFTPAEVETLGWKVVDDGVMGGLSKGNFVVSPEGIATFSGRLSLENNGGFSSVRTGDLGRDLGAFQGLRLRVKGDGRTYQLRLNTDARWRGMEVSFKAEFATQKGEWAEVRVPFQNFVGSFRGRTLRDEVFEPTKIRRLGVLLGDKNPGDFKLELDWIRPYRADDPEAG